MPKIAGLFPGQGSQAVGMGASFYAHDQQSRELFEAANKALGFSLSELCFSGPVEKLTLTANAQPAILTVSYIAYRFAGIKLCAAAGHSLGEYSALVSAGAIGFSDALQLVHKRGRYMQEAVPAGAGKMVAVMGPTEDEISTVIESVNRGIAEIANLNCPGQTVVAGDNAGVNEFSEKMAAQGGKLIPLNVSAPFHCQLMKPAADKLIADLDAISFSDLAFPVYANVTAQAVTSGNQARELLKRQVCASVRWTDCMLNMLKDQQITDTVEFGAGGVLSKLLKRIDKSINRHEVDSPESKLP